MTKLASPLQQISPDDIRKNEDNPRLIFREDEMNELLESIDTVGIKVPLSLFQDGNKYVLIDGERRWRCAKKLNLATVPAIVQPKPTKLENLLMMFNIHNVRVDWDLMPMALKLGEIKDMLGKENRDTSPKALAAITGIRLPSVRRALELLELPKRYQTMLLKEAEKPRDQQRIKVDLFIEIYKSQHSIEKHAPEVFEKVTKSDFVDSMVDKYVTGVVDNVVGFRELSKIARGDSERGGKQHAAPTIVKLVKEKKYAIKTAYEDTVQDMYAQRDIMTRVGSLTRKLSELKPGKGINTEVRAALEQLSAEIERLLRK